MNKQLIRKKTNFFFIHHVCFRWM